MNTQPQEIFLRNRKKFAALYDASKANHEAVVASGRSTIGHGFDHALMVAQYGAIISETERNAEMVWCAALMHNTDRHYDTTVDVIQVIDSYIESIRGHFRFEDIPLILDAVQKHSKMNDDSDSEVLKALKDADRLANSGPVNIFRCALHNHDKPAFILEELTLDKEVAVKNGSTFKKPRSCFDAFFFNEEWRPWLRMPKAIALGKKNFDYLQQHQRDIVEQVQDTGLYGLPVGSL